MINIEYTENLDEEFYKTIDIEFNKFATQNGVTCNLLGKTRKIQS